ncbi:hypothetical protein CBR_g21037 [Chara braunii]|uniref:Uncharacterized protein n=1 Tax=Chara braunii TaxID=69332 RepID=A0A388L0I3_CHABU|nr:hypothetical protein CBR_g21037 [Chara braunii]|eukprot:GBG75791.1 hypothetical protein CBR_g21037 [Chara braunii]
MTFEIDKATTKKGKVDERVLRKLFLTSVFDDQGTDWVKSGRKVSLDLALFKGYGQKAFAMKAFDVKGDETGFRMLYPVDFLNKTNDYRKSARTRTCESQDTRQEELDVEESEERTEEYHRVRQLDARFLVTPRHMWGEGSCDLNVEREVGGGCGARFGDDGEDDEEEGECGSGGGRGHGEGGEDHCDGTTRHMEWERGAASGGMDDDGTVGEDMEEEELEDKGGDVGGTSGEPAVKHKASGRVRKTSQPKKNMRSSRHPKSDDYSDDAEGVDPRMSDLHGDDEQGTNKPRPINMTQCYFLKYNEQGKKRKDPPRVVIDVMQILQIPEGDIAFNQQSLNPAIVAGLEAAIESSIGLREEDGPARWDPPELMLAPIIPSAADLNEQGTRIVLKDFDPDRAGEYFYYTVVGQHTAMKRAMEKGSAIVDIFDIQTYDRWQKDWSNRMRGYMNVATRRKWIRLLVKEFFVKYEARELPLHDNKCPKDLPGRQEGRVSGQFVEEVQGKEEVFHCIQDKDGGANATASFKDLVSSNFKCFEDMTAREKEIPLRLMINKKVIATIMLVPLGKLNMTNLLDIIIHERYMVRLFNYIVFKSKNKETNEWKERFFFAYEEMMRRFGVKADERDEQKDRIPLEYIRKVPKRLGGEQEEKGLKGARLKATGALYRDASFHFKFFVYHTIGKVDLLTTELRWLKNVALHLCWEKKGQWSTLLSINMHPKELLRAAGEVVAATTNLNCKVAILDFATPSHYSAWSPDDFDAVHKMMSKLCGNNWILIVFALQKQ